MKKSFLAEALAQKGKERWVGTPYDEICAVLIIFFVLLAAYSNGFFTSFHYDDIGNIVKNPKVHASEFTISELAKSLHDNLNKNRPLSYLTFAINHSIHGLSVFGYHVVNFLVHFLATVALFMLFRSVLLLRAPPGKSSAGMAVFGAFFASLLWGVHPIQVTAVTFIVQRMTSLCGLFFFLSLWFYILGRTGQRPWLFFFLCVACFFLSLGSKENAVLIPLNLGLIEIIFFHSKWSSRRKIIAAVFVLAFAAYVGYRAWAIWDIIIASYKERFFTLSERLLTEPRIIFFYLSLIVAPWHSRFALLHDIEVSRSLFSPLTTLPSIAGVLILIALAIRMARRYPLISFGVLFFFLNHSLESTFLPLELIYEHRNYIPSAFLFLPIGLGLATLWNRRAELPGRALGAVAAAVGFAILSIFSVQARNDTFTSGLTLWQYHINKYPNYSVPHSNMGSALWQISMSKACLEYGASHFLNKFNNREQYYLNRFNMGLCFFYMQKNPSKALPLMREAAENLSNFIPGLKNLSMVELTAGNVAGALKPVEEGLKRFPDDATLLESMSLIYLYQKDYSRAIATAQRALTRNPAEMSPHGVLGAAYSRLGDYKNSVAHWELFLKSYPKLIYALMSCAYGYGKIGYPKWADNVIENLRSFVPAGQEDNFIAYYRAEHIVPLYIPLEDDFWPKMRRIIGGEKPDFSLEPGSPAPLKPGEQGREESAKK